MYRIAVHLCHNNNVKHYGNDNKNQQIGSNERSLGIVQTT